MNCRFLMFSFLVLFCGAVLFSKEKVPDWVIEGRKILHEQRRWNWKCKVMSVPETIELDARDDYFKATFGHPCDFTNVSGFGPGIKDRRINHGILTFNTGKGADIFWGNYDGKHPGAQVQKIGWNWPVGIPYQWELRFQIKQKLPQSDWTFSFMRRKGSSSHIPLEIVDKKKPNIKRFKVKGTNPQSIRVRCGFNRNTVKGRWLAFRLETTTPGNSVELSRLGLYLMVKEVFFRKIIQIPGGPRKGSLTVVAGPAYTLYVNGNLVKKNQSADSKAPFLTDISAFLKKGRNTILVQKICTPVSKAELVVDGGILDDQGDFIPLISDGSWQYSLDKKNWKPVKIADETVLSGDILPFYFGPVNVDFMSRRSPIYGLKEGIKMHISIPVQQSGTLYYMLTDSFSGKTIEGSLQAVSRTTADNIYEFRYKPETSGVWELILQLKDGDKLISERFIETAVAGKIKQAEVAGNSFTEGMELKLIDTIQCWDADDSHPFIEACYADLPYKTRIVDTPIGKYRESASTRYSWFGYAFKIKNPGQPHLLEAEYPDNAKRTIGLRVGEKLPHQPEVEFQRAHFATFVGSPYPNSNTMKKLYLLYWPNDREETVSILNMDSGSRAAIKTIKIFEITNDVPALKINNAVRRFLGEFSERDYLPAENFYTGNDLFGFVHPRYNSWAFRNHRDFYKNWFKTIVNFIKYMRFSGMNTYLASIHSYGATYLPSEYFGKNGKHRSKDYLDLMLRMFEYNDLNLMLGIESHTTDHLFQKDDTTNQDVREGKSTLRVVSKNGIQAMFFSGGGLNWFAPEVEKENIYLVSEILSFYKEYPAFKGIYYHGWIGPGMVVGYGDSPALDWGYGDVTIRKFEKETGIQIPVPNSDPDRFIKRYDWLLSNYYDDWISWRCRATRNQIKKIADKLKKARKDLTLTMFLASPCKADRKQWERGEITYDEARRRHGHDLKMLNRIDNLTIVNHANESLRPGKEPPYSLCQPEFISPELNALINPEQFGMILTRPFPEPGLFTTFSNRNKWAWKRGNIGFWGMVPPDRFLRQNYVNCLIAGVPEIIFFRQADVNFLTGGEQGMRLFARFFRTLRHGQYHTLTGNGLNKNIIIRRMNKDAAAYVYLLNPGLWKAKTTIRLNGNAEITDLSTNLTTNSRQLELQLDECSGANLRIKPADIKILSAQTEIPKWGLKYLLKQINIKKYRDILAHIQTGSCRHSRHIVQVKKPSVDKRSFSSEGWPVNYKINNLEPGTFYLFSFTGKAEHPVHGALRFRKWGFTGCWGGKVELPVKNAERFEMLLQTPEGKDNQVLFSLTGKAVISAINVNKIPGWKNSIEKVLPPLIATLESLLADGDYLSAYLLCNSYEFKAMTEFAAKRYYSVPSK